MVERSSSEKTVQPVHATEQQFAVGGLQDPETAHSKRAGFSTWRGGRQGNEQNKWCPAIPFFLLIFGSKFIPVFDKTDLVAVILEQSDAVLIVEQVQQKLKSEQQKRQAFYDLIDEDSKAEFVNGAIVYHSPVAKKHNDATKQLLRLLDVFTVIFKLGYVGVEKILPKFTRNDYEPDICFFDQEKAKGFQPGQVIFPVPDLAVEVLSGAARRALITTGSPSLPTTKSTVSASTGSLMPTRRPWNNTSWKQARTGSCSRAAKALFAAGPSRDSPFPLFVGKQSKYLFYIKPEQHLSPYGLCLDWAFLKGRPF